MSIHSSRLGLAGDGSEGKDDSAADSSREGWWADVGGSAGPKSSSSSSEGESFGFSGEEGLVESGAGGREGPRMREGLELSWSSPPAPPLPALEFSSSSFEAMRSEVDDPGREGPRTRRRLGLSEVEETELDRDRGGLPFGRLLGDLSGAWAETWNSASSSRFLFASK